ncbi:MAG TPA: glycosyltransferase family 4 protein [Anaerolineales bacterium]|nr:glycosyltransferase family 4 protein [Anaerolineales bacterium]
MNAQPRPCLSCFLVGDVLNEAGARTKYGLLFEALSRACQVEAIHDLTLRGPARWLNLAQAFHPHPQTWKERFYKNLPAFHLRSQRAARILRQQAAVEKPAPCLIFQVGVLFDALQAAPSLPGVIYTDYTAVLSQRKHASQRFPFDEKQGQQWIALEKQAFARASLIFTRGQFVRRSIIQDYGIAPQRVVAVGGGVNFATLPDPATRSDDIPGPQILFIGKDFLRKGGDILLHAFAQVRQVYPRAHLNMVTSGPIPHAFSQEMVDIIAPTWDRAAIAALYQQADLFVLPSREETWGDVLLEAMAYGLPCIGVTGDAMSEIIAHDTTGLVVAPQPEALASAMLGLLKDPARRQQMGQAARQRVETAYTWEAVVQKMLPFLQGLAG